ncbi:MAG: ATP synthase F1 subunit delta [Acidobacteriota bacterium]
MKERSLARKYTKALVETLNNEDEYRSVKGEVLLFLDMISKDKNLFAGMSTLLFSYQQKLSVLDLLKSKAELNKKTYNFLNVVLEENRIVYLEKMVELMDELWFETQGIEKLKIFSAKVIESDLEKKLIDNLERSFKKKVVLEKEIDRSLIAGIKIQRGSVYYDFSIEGNLKKLKESLLDDLSV